jgi:putative ABC transport system permease protein
MSLSYRTAARIAWRETRSSTTKFVFVVLAVAAGVGALAGVQGFSASFHRTLLDQSRTVMAADLTARQFVPANEKETAALDALARRGVEHTLVTETVSMASSAPALPNSEDATPALISIKAVDPFKYPYYGAVKLEPPIAFSDALKPDTVAVAQDVLLRLNANVGDKIRIGSEAFRISAVVNNEPDRMSGTLNVGLRTMMSREAFERTGLMGFGSRGAYRYLFKLGPGAPPVADVRAALRQALPEALIADFRQSNPIIMRGLDRSTIFLSLVSLIAMIVGALGVAMAMHAHLQQKMDNIAVMKSLGAASRDIIGIYTLQTLMLGLVGGLAGVIVGRIVEHTLPLLISRFFQMDFKIGWNLAASAQGIAVGMLTTLLFTLPPLLAIRKVRPALILRRDMPEAKLDWKRRLADARLSMAAACAILFGIGGIAAWLADSPRVGGYFAGGLTVALIVLALVASGMLRLIRTVVRKSPWRIPTLARQGFANLYRQGNQAQAILVALGLGVMFTLTVYLVQHSLVAEIVQSAPPNEPNVFLIGITPQQLEPLRTLIAKQKGVLDPPEFAPSVAVRIESLNDVPLEELRATGLSRRFRGNRSVMWAEEKPSSLTVTQGQWWTPGETQALVSVDQETARTLGAKVGDEIRLSGAGQTFAARITALHRVDQMRVSAANEFVFNPQALRGFPATYYGGVRMRPSDVGALERASYRVFPTVTIINVAEALAVVQQVVDQVALVIRFLSAFAILAGAIILAASVAGTRFRRVREVVILKTLGATRRSAGRIFSVEFLTLGLVAGLIGSLLASVFSRLLLHRLLDAKFAFDWRATAVAVVLTAVLAQVSGWLASFRILRQKPLEVLREE